MAPSQIRQSPKSGAGRLAPAEEDVKHIADSLHPHPRFPRPRRSYRGNDVDFTQQPQKRIFQGRLARRGPWRQDKQESVSAFSGIPDQQYS